MANIPLNINCGNIELEQIRARVVINDSVIFETPDVLSFSVNKSRSSNIGTFSVTIEAPSNTSFGTPTGTNGRIQIFAGTKLSYLTKGPVFTGRIRSMRPQPTPGKPNYFTLSLQGDDIMAQLQNKRFSRRLPTDGPGLFVVITGVDGPQPTTLTWTIDKKTRSGTSTYTDLKPPTSNREEHNSKTYYRDTKDGAWLSQFGDTPVPEPTGGQAGSGGLNVHDHSTLSKGGPAFGVYGVS